MTKTPGLTVKGRTSLKHGTNNKGAKSRLVSHEQAEVRHERHQTKSREERRHGFHAPIPRPVTPVIIIVLLLDLI